MNICGKSLYRFQSKKNCILKASMLRHFLLLSTCLLLSQPANLSFPVIRFHTFPPLPHPSSHHSLTQAECSFGVEQVQNQTITKKGSAKNTMLVSSPQLLICFKTMNFSQLFKYSYSIGHGNLNTLPLKYTALLL